MSINEYLMENDEEAQRLDRKTDRITVEKQALWAGIQPGMKVADVCCGSGKTTSVLHQLVQPGGEAVGIDGSGRRLEYAREHYGADVMDFACRNILEPLDSLGTFDFVWVRFVLEYHRSNGLDVVRNISRIVKPGGILCLIDLDYNCLSHFGISQRLEQTLFAVIKTLEERANFDPYAGRKLYSYLYDLGYQDIDVDIAGHHVITGELRESDAYNWMKKVEVVSKKVAHLFDEYEGGYEGFLKEFKTFFSSPRRFTYSPLISCRGRRPS